LPATSDLHRRLIVTLTAFGALAVAACLLAPLVGSTRISLVAVFDRSTPFAENVDAQIFFIARLPRVLAAAMVGCALALAGVVFQALLRNPLASPDTLGVSAGAALGAMLALTLHADFTLFGVSAVPLASFAGSLGALVIVYGLAAARRRGTTTMVLLLAGVTLTALLSAVVRFVQFLADFTETLQTTRWLMGSLDVGSYTPIVAALLPMSCWTSSASARSRRRPVASTSTCSSASRWSVHRSPREPPSRSPDRSVLSGSWCRTSCAWWSARIIAS
jgi:iron complex transport system permease protein